MIWCGAQHAALAAPNQFYYDLVRRPFISFRRTKSQISMHMTGNPSGGPMPDPFFACVRGFQAPHMQNRLAAAFTTSD
jgi:hypothetical protein